MDLSDKTKIEEKMPHFGLLENTFFEPWHDCVHFWYLLGFKPSLPKIPKSNDNNSSLYSSNVMAFRPHDITGYFWFNHHIQPTQTHYSLGSLIFHHCFVYETWSLLISIKIYEILWHCL